MKKTMHTWLSLVALLLACVLALGTLAGCADDKNGDSTVTTDGNTDAGLVYPEACDNHHGDFICENCGNRMTPNGFFTGLKEYENKYSLVLNGLTVNIEGSGRLNLTACEMTIDFTDGKINGNGHAEGSYVSISHYSGSDSDGNEIASGTEEETYAFSGSLVINDGKTYLDATYTVTDDDGTSDSIPLVTYFDLADYFTLMGVSTEIQEILETLPETFEQDLLPLIKDFLEKNGELEDVCARLANLIFTLTKTDNSYTIAFSMDKLIALNNKLAEITVAEFYDSIFGEGKFAKLETFANGLLDKTVGGLLLELKAKGVDVEKLLGIVKSYYPVEDDGESILSRLLNIGKYATMNVSEFIGMEDSDSIAAAKETIANIFTTLKTTKVWDGIESLIPGGSDDSDNIPSNPTTPNPTADADSDSDSADQASLHDTVANVLNSYKSAVKFSVSTSLSGHLSGLNVDVEIQNVVSVKVDLAIKTEYTSTVDYSNVEPNVKKQITKLEGLADQIGAAALKSFANDNDYSATYSNGILTLQWTEYEDWDYVDHEWVGINGTDCQVKLNLKSILHFNLQDAEYNVYYLATEISEGCETTNFSFYFKLVDGNVNLHGWGHN